MEYEQFEAYKGPMPTLRQLDNIVRRLVGDYGNAPVTLKTGKNELTVLVGRPVVPDAPDRTTIEDVKEENKVTNRNENNPEITKQYI